MHQGYLNHYIHLLAGIGHERVAVLRKLLHPILIAGFRLPHKEKEEPKIDNRIFNI